MIREVLNLGAGGAMVRWRAYAQDANMAAGRAEIAVYRLSDGVWYTRRSSSGYSNAAGCQEGLTTDVPLQADFEW